jgi:hypothetical protein
MTINAPVEIFVIKTHSVLNYCHFRRAKISRASFARIGAILNC